LNRLGREVFYINPTIMYHSKKDISLKVQKIDGINVCTFYSNYHRSSYYVGVKKSPDHISVEFARELEHLLAVFANFSSVVKIQQPGWWSVVRHMMGNQIIFDCMDLHSGFKDIVTDV
jgi:hypothetical protein